MVSGPDVKKVMTKSSSDRGEGEQRAGDQRRAHMRHQDVAERLPIVGAEIARRLLLLLVEAR